MPMTDADRLSTPVALVGALSRLTTILRDVEALPATARQHFWDDLHMPIEDLRIDADVSLQTVSVLYNILVTMCGPKLTELVNGATKEYYESIILQMKEVGNCDWGSFLDQKLDATKGTDHEGSLAVTTAKLRTSHDAGCGLLRRVEGTSKILRLTSPEGKERYFSSKDIVLMELAIK